MTRATRIWAALKGGPYEAVHGNYAHGNHVRGNNVRRHDVRGIDVRGIDVRSGRPSGRPLDPRGERGMAIVLALMAMLLLSALGAGLVLTTSTETLITANYRDNAEAMYAADAGVERVLEDLLIVPDWNQVLNGTERSSFIDGPPSGERDTPFGGKIDLTKATNLLNCDKVTTCSATDMNAWTDERPWTTNNPRWQLYAYGPISDLIESSTIDSRMYVVVWVADDPSENDNDPTIDGVAGSNPGRGQVAMRAEAFGPGSINRVIEVTVARTDTSEIERGYLAQRGQDEQNLRARRSAVGRPGQTLGRSTISLVP